MAWASRGCKQAELRLVEFDDRQEVVEPGPSQRLLRLEDFKGQTDVPCLALLVERQRLLGVPDRLLGHPELLALRLRLSLGGPDFVADALSHTLEVDLAFRRFRRWSSEAAGPAL